MNPMPTTPERSGRLRAPRALVALLAIASLVLAACGGSGSAADEVDADATAAAAGSGDRVFEIWHYEGENSAMGIAWAEALEQFQEANPDVTVQFEEKGFEQIRQTAQMVLNSDEAPDVLEYNKGSASAGLLASQGLLTDLTEPVEQHGWDAKLSESLQTTARYDDRGVMGSGPWYGIPNYGEYVMVYYNVDAFEEHGLEVPTSLEELEQAMQTFVDAGTTPLALGGAEYPAQQVWYELALSQADRDLVERFQLFSGEVDFHNDAFTFGAERFAEWMERGFISEDATGIKAEDMGVSFTRGDYPILISGSWWFGRFKDEISDFEWDTFLFPGNDLHPGSSGNLWVVPTSADDKDLAYEFIEITMQEDIQNLLGSSGGIPVAADPSAIADEKDAQLIEQFNEVTSSNGLAFYPDWPAAGYYDTLVSGVQQLMGGTSPEAFLDQIAGPWQQQYATVSR